MAKSLGGEAIRSGEDELGTPVLNLHIGELVFELNFSNYDDTDDEHFLLSWSEGGKYVDNKVCKNLHHLVNSIKKIVREKS